MTPHRFRATPVLPLAGLILALCACTGPRQPACEPGLGTPMSLFTLYLGEAIPGRTDLTDKEWQSFLDGTVTVNLPNGYTVLDGFGAWMNPATHKTSREATKVVVVALPDAPESLAAINRIRNEYVTMFHQQLVGMTVQPACASF